jgi:hypothetical protein
MKHDLKRSDYEFQSNVTGEFADRFSLEFIDRSIDIDVDDLLEGNQFVVSNDFDVMKVQSGKTVDEIKVYDLLGRVIMRKSPNQKTFEMNTSTVKIGTVMIIEARMDDGSMINTKSIKH